MGPKKHVGSGKTESHLNNRVRNCSNKDKDNHFGHRKKYEKHSLYLLHLGVLFSFLAWDPLQKTAPNTPPRPAPCRSVQRPGLLGSNFGLVAMGRPNACATCRPVPKKDSFPAANYPKVCKNPLKQKEILDCCGGSDRWNKIDASKSSTCKQTHRKINRCVSG